MTAYVFRFVHNLNSECLDHYKWTNAQLYLIRGIQRLTYREKLAIAYLLKKQPKCPPLVRQPRLYHDDNQLIRCGGRIHSAPSTELAKFPFLLPSICLFTDMIVMATHRRLHYGGVSVTTTALRQVYWIPQHVGTSGNCYDAVLHATSCWANYIELLTLPLCQRSMSLSFPPFTVTGVDFTSALYIKDRAEESKVYICILICATTCALHIEVVTDLTVDTFLLAFRRFFSRKSLFSTMISDKASTFLAAAED